MNGTSVLRFGNRWKPTEYINNETGKVITGPIAPGWLSAQWEAEPVSGTSYVRFKNVWKPEQYLHIEGGIPEVGMIAPGWLSAQWEVEEIPGTLYKRLRNRWNLIRYAHVQFGQIGVEHVEPGWLSAHWLLEKVEGSSIVRLRNRWQTDQCLHIEFGPLSAGHVEPGWLSAQWTVERVPGTPYVRFKNVWQPERYFHIQNGVAEASPIAPGWLSAQWLLEPVPGTNFVWLRNVWEFPRHLHIENGTLEAGSIGPGWLSAQWLVTDANRAPVGELRRREIPLEVLQQKFDIFINDRTRPLFSIKFHNKGSGDHRHSTVDVLFDDPAKGYVSKLRDGEPMDLGQQEIDLPWAPNPDFYFSELESRQLTANIIPGEPVGIETAVFFETDGEEMIVNNFPNVDFEGFNIKIRFTVGYDQDNGLVDLKADSIDTDASVNVSGLPDGRFASGVEKKFNSKLADGLKQYRADINGLVTRIIVAGKFYVMSVSNDAQNIYVDYILPQGQVEPFPEKVQAPLDRGLLKNIEHIVVVMMENRSFDHMLGYLSKEGHMDGSKRPDVDGLRGGETNPYKGQKFQSFPLTDTHFLESPCHSFECVLNQVDAGKMDGFVADFADQYETSGTDPSRIMGYHTSATLPVYDALAREFLVSDRWFAAHPGPTFCNRFYTLTGRLNRDTTGRFEFNNPHGSDFTPVSTRTIFDHLNDHGIFWRYYEHGYCFLRMFERYTFDNQNIVDAGNDSINFVNSALNGTLPSVTFIDPDFIDVPPGFDDGPPADVAAGQHFIGTVVNALMKGPLWSKTLLIITYDEHGGFYDHVPPPKAVPVSAVDDYGVRVPTFVISPWVEGGKATSTTHANLVFDHTSIAKTIARCFMSANPPDMGERMAAANDLSMVLRSTPRTDKPEILIPATPPVRTALALRAVQDMQDEQDFKGVLNAIRARYPTPTPV